MKTAVGHVLSALSAVLVTSLLLYIGSYFIIMRPGLALNRESMQVDYPSVCMFSSPIRFGNSFVYTQEPHWMNLIYAPLDPFFRKSEIAEMQRYNHRYKKTAEQGAAANP